MIPFQLLHEEIFLPLSVRLGMLLRVRLRCGMLLRLWVGVAAEPADEAAGPVAQAALRAADELPVAGGTPQPGDAQAVGEPSAEPVPTVEEPPSAAPVAGLAAAE